MPDELFRDQIAQLESLLHKDENNNNGVIFKDQSALLESLPAKKSPDPRTQKSQPSSAIKPVSKPEEGKANYFSGIFTRLFVVVVFIVAVIAVTVAGGFIFVAIEKTDDRIYQPFTGCFNEALENDKAAKNSTENIIALQKCIRSKQKLYNLPAGSLFTWSIYTTIGYGHRFPFTFYGQLICVLLVNLLLPLYMALKFELGEIISLIILALGSKLKRLVIHFGPECLTKSMRKEKYHPSDLATVAILFIICSIFTLLLTVVVMYSSYLSFWKAFYLTIHTILQVGLGDVTPNEEWPTFVFVMPLVLLGDVLTSFLHYYINGIYRLQVHRLAHCVSGRNYRNEEDVPKGQELVMANSVADFVTVTNHAMPLRATSHEIMRREVPDYLKTAKSHKKSTKNTKEKKPKIEDREQLTTPPESAKEDDTQEDSQHFLLNLGRHSREKIHIPPRSKEPSLKTVAKSNSMGTMIEEDLKTPQEHSLKKKKSWIGKPGRTMSHHTLITQEASRKGTRENVATATTPLLRSTERIKSQEKLNKDKSHKKIKEEAKKHHPPHHHPPPKKKTESGRTEVVPEQLRSSREPDESWF